MSKNIPVAEAFAMTQVSSFKLCKGEIEQNDIKTLQNTPMYRREMEATKPDKKKRQFQRENCLEMLKYLNSP